MAANVKQTPIWKCAAVFLAVAVASASAVVPGTVSLFTFTSPATGDTSISVEAGKSVTFRCRVDYNVSYQRSPSIHLDKKFGNYTWEVSTNDELVPEFEALQRIDTIAIDPQLNGHDVYDWTINNLQVGDTGIYICYVGKGNVSRSSISLNVTAPPTQLGLYIDGVLQPQSMLPAVNKKILNLGQSYRIACAATGGNPFPQVTLMSGTTVMSPVSTNMTTTRADFEHEVAAINRSTTIVASWTMTNANLWIPVTCNAGLGATVSISNSFIPIADNVLPSFTCPDQFTYDGMSTKLTITCQVFSTNLTSYYISWQNSTTNITVQGSKGVEIQASKDSRYSLLVNAPQGGNVGWSMTLTINNANMITDLKKLKFHFVAISTTGQAVHDVTVMSAGMPGGTSGGHSAVQQVGYMALLISVAMATLFGRL